MRYFQYILYSGWLGCVVGPCKGGVTVWFFGTYEMGCIKPAEIVGLRTGLDQELHVKCKRAVKVFQRALHEAYTYLQASLLPYAELMSFQSIHDQDWLDT